jgi:hypothetical protein
MFSCTPKQEITSDDHVLRKKCHENLCHEMKPTLLLSEPPSWRGKSASSVSILLMCCLISPFVDECLLISDDRAAFSILFIFAPGQKHCIASQRNNLLNHPNLSTFHPAPSFSLAFTQTAQLANQNPILLSNRSLGTPARLKFEQPKLGRGAGQKRGRDPWGFR